MPKNKRTGIIAGCVAIIVLLIALTGGSPGKKAGKAYCRCYESFLKQMNKGADDEYAEREMYRSFNKKLEKYWKHIEKVSWGEPEFKNPKHQRIFEETVKNCEEKLSRKYDN